MTTKKTIDQRIEELLPEGFSYGYIGNLYSDGTDDRSWTIFRAHPGRIGKREDRFGDYSTEDRGKLLQVAAAIKFARGLGS